MKKIEKIVFIRVSSWFGQKSYHPENIMAPLDIGISINILKKNGFKTFFIDTELGKITIDNILEEIKSYNPEIIIFWGITSSYNNIVSLRKRIIKYNKNIITIAVGQHATEKPESYLNNGIDYCISGEFEGIIEKVIYQIQNNEIENNIYVSKKKKNNIKKGKIYIINNLDDLPYPDHNLFYNKPYQVFHPVKLNKKLKWGFIIGSRGCPYRCIYCSPTLRSSYGKKVRLRNINNIIKELKLLKKIGFTIFHFKDDNFISSKKWVSQLCREIIKNKIDIPWTIQTRVDNIDYKILKAMKEAYCSTISIGVESGSQKILDKLRKDISIDKIIEAFHLSKKVGLLRVAFFMIGNPNETIDDIKLTKNILKKIKSDMVQIAFFTPYPGSPFYINNKRKINTTENLSHYNKVSNYSNLNDEEIIKWQKKLYFYFLINLGGLFKYYWNKRIQFFYNLKQEIRFIHLAFSFLMKRVLRKND